MRSSGGSILSKHIPSVPAGRCMTAPPASGPGPAGCTTSTAATADSTILSAVKDELETNLRLATKSDQSRVAYSVEIQSCLVSSGDVGCGTFQCFNNNSCEIQGLHHICLTLLHNAGRYDSQGKSFVKDALRCMALGLRQRFSCVSRRCSAVKEMVYSLQRECYSKHQLCLALRDHMDTTGNLVQFHLMFPPGPYVELVNFLLKCGDEVRSWVSRRLRGQCEQHWGALCRSFGSTCSLSQSDVPQHTTAQPSTVPWPITAQGPMQQPTRAAEQNDRSGLDQIDNTTETGLSMSERTNGTAS